MHRVVLVPEQQLERGVSSCADVAIVRRGPVGHVNVAL